MPRLKRAVLIGIPLLLLAATSLTADQGLSEDGLPSKEIAVVENTMSPEEIIDYWTPERMAATEPILIPVDARPTEGAVSHAPDPDVVFNTPYSAGYIYSYPQVGRLYSNSGSCTATLVGRNTLLTAAHCVVKITPFAGGCTWLESRNQTFVPGLQGNTQAYGQWPTVEFSYYRHYRDTCGAFGPLDYALIYLGQRNGQSLGDLIAPWPTAYDSQGGWNYSAGYPGEGWFEGSDRCLGGYCWQYHCQAPLGNYYRQVADSTVSYGGWYEIGFGCYMTGGSSGGPVLQYVNGQWRVISVNSHITGIVYYNNCVPSANNRCIYYARNMWGPYFNHWFRDLFNANVRNDRASGTAGEGPPMPPPGTPPLPPVPPTPGSFPAPPGGTPAGTPPPAPTTTATPPPPPTPTPTSVGLRGDVNCNGVVDAIDAALVLQFDGGLLGSLPCQANGLVNGDGSVNALDALLILQYAGGLLEAL